MTKWQKKIFVCSDCGHTEPKWLGRCKAADKRGGYVYLRGRISKTAPNAGCLEKKRL
ncbi:MAG: hypothetical protein JW904_10505 [Spirochaetales bacterium]|nr:hypothetical protein [Spirochaetales bacterium]